MNAQRFVCVYSLNWPPICWALEVPRTVNLFVSIEMLQTVIQMVITGPITLKLIG